mmetsp:Transcript_56360/g.98440  ORF Transcript_56360/g.98440 Transcript_56360/m.98440 type:complete len:289 (-) Transcript_56360:151-1017(-)
MRDGNVVQWAVATSPEADFVVFKGTSKVVDLIVNGGFLSHDEADHGLRVHSGMWTALTQRKSHTFRGVLEELKKLHHVPRCETCCAPWTFFRRTALRNLQCLEHRVEKPVVLCGHSLGGGYALLSALELLHNKFPVAAVVTYGAPQVIVPDYKSALWQKLNSISTLFINSYDLVPRLPSCLEWVFDVVRKSLERHIGPLTISLDISRLLEQHLGEHKAAAADYNTVGTLMFLSASSASARRYLSTDHEHNEVLGHVPARVGPFILDHHDMNAYLRIISGLQPSPLERS